MNTASLELCKELYKLSAWEERLADDGFHPVKCSADTVIPKYTAGYLLRKLPRVVGTIGAGEGWLNVTPVDDKPASGWHASYGYYESRQPLLYQKWSYADADTPENALCKLAIELFKNGILERKS